MTHSRIALYFLLLRLSEAWSLFGCAHYDGHIRTMSVLPFLLWDRVYLKLEGLNDRQLLSSDLLAVVLLAIGATICTEKHGYKT